MENLNLHQTLRSQPHFVEPGASKGHKNVTLVSKEGKHVYLNACVFASLSKMCYLALKESEEEGLYLIQTELSTPDLFKICTFATTGQIYGFKDACDLLQDQILIQLFLNFGIDLSKIGFLSLDDTSSRSSEEDIKEELSSRDPISHLNLQQPTYHHEQSNHRPGTKKSKSIGLKDESGPGYIKQEEVDAEDYLEVELNKVGVEEEEAYDEDTWGQDLNYLPPYPENSFGAGSNNSAKSKVSRAGVKRKVEPDNEWLPGGGLDDDEEEEKPLKAPKKRKKYERSGKYKGKKKYHQHHDKNLFGEPVVFGKNLFWFPQDEKYRNPKKKHHCTLCVRGFNQTEFLQQHIKRHSAKSQDDRYFCLFCDDYVAFPTREELNIHWKYKHKDNKDDNLNCPHCGKLFSRQYRHQLTMHIKNEHTDTFVQCASCGSVVKNQKALDSHTKRFGPLHDTKCRICPDFEAFNWEDNLRHINKHHDGEIQIKCGFCPAYFLHQSQRQDHLNVCPAEKPKSFLKEQKKNQERAGTEKQLCPFCATSLRPLALQLHIKRAHGTHSIPCTEPGCDEIIRHPDFIEYHMKTHEKTICSECPWTGLKRHLPRHKRNAHTDDRKKKYPCQICKKGFADLKRFKDHMNVHTGEKPWKCPECGQGFASQGTMYGHLRNVHKGQKRK